VVIVSPFIKVKFKFLQNSHLEKTRKTQKEGGREAALLEGLSQPRRRAGGSVAMPDRHRLLPRRRRTGLSLAGEVPFVTAVRNVPSVSSIPDKLLAVPIPCLWKRAAFYF